MMGLILIIHPSHRTLDGVTTSNGSGTPVHNYKRPNMCTIPGWIVLLLQWIKPS